MAFALRNAASTSGMSQTVAAPAVKTSRRSWVISAASAGLATACGGAYWLGRKSAGSKPPSYRRLTFRPGLVGRARFGADGETIVYAARWQGCATRLYAVSGQDSTPREIAVDGLDYLTSLSSNNELAVLLTGSVLARLPLSGGAPRRLLEDVIAADWSPDGKSLAISRRVGEKTSIEYPIGKVLYEGGPHSIFWIRVSPEGDRIAFSDMTRGYKLKIVDRSGTTTDLASFDAPTLSTSRPCWTPDGREVWMDSPLGTERGVIYAFDMRGNRRVVVSLPDNVLVESISRTGKLLFVALHGRLGWAGLAPGETVERDLSAVEHASRPLLSADGGTFVLTDGSKAEGMV